MHTTAMEDARRFVDRYLSGRKTLSVADVGSFDVNGTMRPLFDRPGWTYCGIDIAKGPNVDHVVSQPYCWAEIETATFDVVVSSQTLEHIRHPWRWMPEVARICAPGGLIYICSPNTWVYHEYPIDCWRIWPEGMKALFAEADIDPIHVYFEGNDTTGIGRRKSASEMAFTGSAQS